MIALLRQHFFDFERAEARCNALLLLLAAAIVSPDISMPSPLPAIRLEQIGLALLLPSLFFFCKRHPEARRLLFVDFAFAALGVAIAVSLVFAPVIVEQSHYSLRDPFELARVAEYWLMFRLAFSVVPDYRAVSGVTVVLLVAAVGSGLVSVLQYLGPRGFNDAVTSIWADSHNFDGVVRRSRVVGMVGNPNYFGIFSGLLLTVSLALVLLRYPASGLGRRGRWLIGGAVLLSTAGVVMSQSRTAGLAVLGAMFLALCFVLLARRRQAAYGAAIGLFVVSLVVSVAFVEIFPPKYGTFHDRFSLAGITDDPSVTIRISKWKSLFSGFFHDAPDRCADANVNARPTRGHEPAQISSASVPADALARDATRKQDITAISRAIQRYSCDADKWPTGDLAAAVVPKYLPSLPRDPKSGAAYHTYLLKGGFMVGADLENQADPEGPLYSLGTVPNIIVNPSFESSPSTTANWETARSVDGRPTTTLTPVSPGVFGKTALNADIGPTGSLYQLTVFDFPIDADYTATIWARSNAGADQKIYLYLIGILSDGTTLDPMARTEARLPGDGRWLPVRLTFKTPSPSRLSVLQFSVRAPGGDENARVTVDGAMVNQGPFPASFPFVEDVNPSRLRPTDIAGFSDSPFIGIGPQKDRQVGAFDNEYALMLDRYGGLGTLAYLTLMAAAFAIPLRGFRLNREGSVAPQLIALSLGIATYTVAQAAFNVAAGSYYSFQLMAIYWLALGFIGRGVVEARRRPVEEAETASVRTGAVHTESARPLAGADPGRVAADPVRAARRD